MNLMRAHVSARSALKNLSLVMEGKRVLAGSKVKNAFFIMGH